MLEMPAGWDVHGETLQAPWVLAQQRPQAPRATELCDGTTHGYRSRMMPRTSDAIDTEQQALVCALLLSLILLQPNLSLLCSSPSLLK